MSEHRESATFLRRLYKDICMYWGAPEHQAEAFSHAILTGDLMGFVAQGNVIAQIAHVMVQHDQINLEAEPTIEQEGPNYAVMDGQHGLGQYVMKCAMELAIEKAKQSVIGTVWVRDWHDIGCVSAYTRLALEHDMVGIVTVNSVPLTAPYGGRDMAMSAAPLAFACPSHDAMPIIGDLALCQTYDYYFNIAIQEGKKLPGKWLVDPETGELTDDPAPYVDDPSHRSSGVRVATVFPDPKLYVLNIFAEMLTGFLTPGGWTSDKHEYPSREYISQGIKVRRGGGGFVMAIDPSQLMPLTEFKARVDDWVRMIKGGGLQSGFSEILIPGERALREEKKRRTEGVPIRPDQWAKLTLMAEEAGLDLAALRASY